MENRWKKYKKQKENRVTRNKNQRNRGKQEQPENSPGYVKEYPEKVCQTILEPLFSEITGLNLFQHKDFGKCFFEGFTALYRVIHGFSRLLVASTKMQLDLRFQVFGDHL